MQDTATSESTDSDIARQKLSAVDYTRCCRLTILRHFLGYPYSNSSHARLFRFPATGITCLAYSIRLHIWPDYAAWLVYRLAIPGSGDLADGSLNKITFTTLQW